MSAPESSWWAQALPEGADVSDANACDAAARVLFAFGGDHTRLAARNQMMFELARTLTGEAPGPLLAVAVMTYGENTHSHLTTRHRDISLR